MLTAAIDAQGVRCCLEHLQRTSRGIIRQSTVAGVSTEAFMINAAHCRNGERARCNICQYWKHVCGENGSCEWTCVSRKDPVNASK